MLCYKRVQSLRVQCLFTGQYYTEDYPLTKAFVLLAPSFDQINTIASSKPCKFPQIQSILRFLKQARRANTFYFEETPIPYGRWECWLHLTSTNIGFTKFSQLHKLNEKQLKFVIKGASSKLHLKLIWVKIFFDNFTVPFCQSNIIRW